MLNFLAPRLALFALIVAGALPAWGQDTKGVRVVTALTGMADLNWTSDPRRIVGELRAPTPGWM